MKNFPLWLLLGLALICLGAAGWAFQFGGPRPGDAASLPMLTWHSTSGPFLALTRDNGVTWQAGAPVNAVKAGGRIAWINNMTVVPNTTGCIDWRLVNLATRVAFMHVVRCGVRLPARTAEDLIQTFQTEPLTPTGDYQILRTGTFRLGRREEIDEFPPINIHIIGREDADGSDPP